MVYALNFSRSPVILIRQYIMNEKLHRRKNMNKFVPYDKLSKKKKKELNAEKRTVWFMDPVTRKSENPRAYNRRKALRTLNDSGSERSAFSRNKGNNGDQRVKIRRSSLSSSCVVDQLVAKRTTV